MLWTSSLSETDNEGEVSYARANCVRIIPIAVEQSRLDNIVGRDPAKNEETVPGLVSESDDEDKVLTRITPEMLKDPKFYLVPYGNKLPRTMSTAVARIHDENISCTPQMNRKNEITQDLPRLVLDEIEAWVSSYKGADNLHQRGSIQYTIQQDDKVYLHPRTDMYCLERDGAWHPFDALMLGPIRPPLRSAHS